MTDTINNGIPFVPENTIDPAAGLNLSLNTVDALLQVLVQSVGVNTPPVATEGQRFIVGTAPTGGWSGQANKLARWLAGSWQFFDARYALNAVDGQWYVRSGSTWAVAPAGPISDGSVTNPKLSSMASQTIKGRASPGSGAPEDLTAAQARSVISVRELLAGPRTYYVRTDGNDSNDGLSNTAGGAFLTLQKAVDVCSAIDLGIHDIEVRCTGAFTTGYTLKTLVGSGLVRIRGNTDDTSGFTLTASGAGGTCVSLGSGFSGTYSLEFQKLSAPGVGANCIAGKGGGGTVIYGNIEFGLTSSRHIRVRQNQLAQMIGPVLISGGALRHVDAGESGGIRMEGTITLTGTPAFTDAFAYCLRGGFLNSAAVTYVGSATGKRYDVNSNGVIIVDGAGATFLPGSVDGVATTGGQYV